ncbi:MAG: gliding motility protein GldN [Flavobacteriales bacterium]|nr:gliding motility protein GldN [Flavobacteriales bacterium]MBP6696685.1 gliding motility protein GldN [Flavobacteriales bacterium]
MKHASDILRSGLIGFGLLALAAFPATAQTVLDGAYIKEHTKTKRVVPYTHIREADVMYARRVWRELDMREKINHPIYYPISPINDRKSLFDVIRQGLLTDGSITAYSAGVIGDEDEFKKPLLASELKELFLRVDTQLTEDPNNPGEFIQVVQEIPLESGDVKRYRLKEDWIFDKQRSKIDIRIIGIAPMREKMGDDGESKGYQVLFWLYYPECRYVFANWEVFNRENDAERRSFEDIFWKRQFSSTITKWSNVYDRGINQYRTGLDALLEGEEIKQSLFEFEHDLWNF